MLLQLVWSVPAREHPIRWLTEAGDASFEESSPPPSPAQFVNVPVPYGDLVAAAEEVLPSIVGEVSSSLLLTAAIPIGGQRAVTVNSAGQAIYADHRYLVAGGFLALSTNAAASGAQVTALHRGEQIEAVWTWNLGPVYVGQDGLLTQIPPTTGVLAQIGSATAPNKLFVDPRLIAAV